MYLNSSFYREEFSIEWFAQVDNTVQEFITQVTEVINANDIIYPPWVTQLTLNALNHVNPDLKELKQASKSDISLLCFLVAINPKISSLMFKTIIKDEAILSFVVSYSNTPDSVLARVIKVASVQNLSIIALRPNLSTENVRLLVGKNEPKIVESLTRNRNLTVEQVETIYEQISDKAKKEALIFPIRNETNHLTIFSILAHPNVPQRLLAEYALSENFTLIAPIVRSKRVTDEIINQILFPDGLLRAFPEEIIQILDEIIKNPRTSTVTLMRIVTVLNNIPVKDRPRYDINSIFASVDNIFSNRSSKRMRKELSRFLTTVPGYDETDYSVVPFEWIKTLVGTVFDEQYDRQVSQLASV